MNHIKTVKVTNPKNVLVQMPKHIVDGWGLKEGDSVEVHSDKDTIIIKPGGGYVNIRVRSGSDKESN